MSGCGRAIISKRRCLPRTRRTWPGNLPTQGRKHLHIVDLEGAREGLPVNLPSVQEILAAVDIECELGGGIRDEQSVQEIFDFGLSRLVIGTSALTDPDWFRAACGKYPGRMVLGNRCPRWPGGHRWLAQHQQCDGDRFGPAIRKRTTGRHYLHRHRYGWHDARAQLRRWPRCKRPWMFQLSPRAE